MHSSQSVAVWQETQQRAPLCAAVQRDSTLAVLLSLFMPELRLDSQAIKLQYNSGVVQASGSTCKSQYQKRCSTIKLQCRTVCGQGRDFCCGCTRSNTPLHCLPPGGALMLRTLPPPPSPAWVRQASLRTMYHTV